MRVYCSTRSSLNCDGDTRGERQYINIKGRGRQKIKITWLTMVGRTNIFKRSTGYCCSSFRGCGLFVVFSLCAFFLRRADGMNNSETLLPGIYWGREKCMSHYPGLLAKPVFLDALIPMQWEIPVYVVSFNNPTFVKKMIAQLLCYNSTVVVVDTGSTYPPLLDFLAQFQQSTGQISIRRIQGITYGHIPYDWYRKVIANGLSTPRFAALTDADLTFNRNLPPNFLQVLAYLNLKLSAKVGFALDLTKRNLFWKRA